MGSAASTPTAAAVATVRGSAVSSSLAIAPANPNAPRKPATASIEKKSGRSRWPKWSNSAPSSERASTSAPAPPMARNTTVAVPVVTALPVLMTG